MLPAKDQDTRHTTSGNLPAGAAAPAAWVGETDAEDGSSAVLTHGAVGESFVQISTVLSCVNHPPVSASLTNDKQQSTRT